MALMFLYGVGWSLSFDLGVRVYVAELVALLGLVILNLSAAWREHKILRSVLAAYAIWVMAIILSDYVNDIPFIDFARNAATPIIGGISLVFVVASLTKKPAAAFAFLIGTVLAKAIFGDAAYGDTFADVAVSFETIQQDTNIFKVRIDPFLTPALLLVSCFLIRFGKLRSAAFLAFCSIFYFALDARSSALILALTSLLIAAAGVGYRPNMRQVIVAVALSLPLLYAAYVGYVEYTMEFNPNGHNGKQLQRLDNPHNPFALLLQARSEWLVWPVAFAEKPIFGWGSWAIDVDGRFQALRALMTDQGQGIFSYNRWDQGYIPVHSLVGTALVWSGIVGLVAALMLVRIIFRLMYYAPSVRPAYLPIVSFFGFMLLFHFLFSPPQHVRITFPFALGLLIVATASTRQLMRGKVGRKYVIFKKLGATN
ncbi:hypothetical protein INR77_04540 [Erythrobacter sp. SCSIO 43205]|uniref:hypothetical protein n=1 Tax=Erythrobacter sp. SCSIO 43205 TaxID=2779361 RepID=UPI001CA9B50E|nr:hypothetical protein [Erythrobacter sp. SCSIO 43205]UAB78971.1 hypothetical protein INR77_04540 [Erythrobacter sp. SCSIO 43205]